MDIRPVCVRVARRLQYWWQRGWKPRLNTVGFLEWDPREYNCYADHAANVALDCGKDWAVKTEQAPESMQANSWNLRLCCDGARRGDGQSAAGLALFCYTGSSRVLLCRAGAVLNNLTSAFIAELLALEWALDWLDSFMCELNL
eukprot:7047775-Karenia_brevis.AAC.1